MKTEKTAMTAAAVCLLCAAFTEAYVPAAEEPAPSDKVTVMVYMIGSDLESEYGCASADLEEMMAAEQGEQMTVVVQTGGALQWENSSILPGSCQRFVMKDHALTEWENIGLKSMAQPDTLADFIRWGASNFPAERYELILWDHGGGTAAGYGYDEYFPEDWMSLSELAAALEQGGCHFDMIGFDACLMGTVEMAYAVSPYADYLVASEESLPQEGFSTVAITDQDSGDLLFSGEPTIKDRLVTLDLPADISGGPGDYTVGFQILSSDGHATRSETTFTVVGDAQTTATTTGTDAKPVEETTAAENTAEGATSVVSNPIVLTLAGLALFVVIAGAIVLVVRSRDRR